MFVTRISLVTLSFLTFVHGQCIRQEDKYIDGLCYRISNVKKTFSDAQEECHRSNTNLGVVKTPNQAVFISTYVRAQCGDGLFWIGLSRPVVSSKFNWDDGTSLVWTNFDPNYISNGLYVVESTSNGKWQTVDKSQLKIYICSYEPGATVPTYSTSSGYSSSSLSTKVLDTTVQTTTSPRPTVTCLFMVDAQSGGPDANSDYQKYYSFAQQIGNKLANTADFSGNIDYFGYGDPEDHENYQPLGIDEFNQFSLSTDLGDDIAFDLKDVDASLTEAVWVPPVKDQTCLVFVSAAPEAEYGGTTIQITYTSFTTVIGALVGGATSIPGLTNVVASSTMTDDDAQAVVDLLLKNLPVV